MKKLLKSSVVIFVLICVTVSATSCFGPKPANVYLDGGTLPDSYNEATLEEISNSRPTKEGMEFAGWYNDAAYNSYIVPGAVTSSQQDKNVAYAKWIYVSPSQSYDVRQSEATITDSGRANQAIDQVPISNDYNVVDMARAGYSSLKVKVTLDIREMDDGYQYIFLYSDTNCPSDNFSLDSFYDKYVFGEDEDDPSLLATHKYEHGAGVKNSEWETVSFTVSVPLDRLTKDIYVRYGASGNGEDTWVNRNVSVEVTPLK